MRICFHYKCSHLLSAATKDMGGFYIKAGQHGWKRDESIAGKGVAEATGKMTLYSRAIKFTASL